ncbi:MAG: rod shape-determining protein MreC [Candidatus Desulforudis sp.]|nr:rod shape-determining protein MreC [Desulforudis sp.]
MKRLRLKGVLAAAIVVLLLLGMMHITGLERDELTVLEAGLRDGVGFVQGTVMQVGYQLREGFRHLVHFGGTGDTEELRRQVRELEAEIGVLREYQLQNERLRQLLDYRETNPGFDVLVAEVVARDPGNWFSIVKVNRGVNQGVRRDQAVILPAGLVGRVIFVAPNTADVLLITDPRSGVGAMLQDSRTPGVVKGVLDSARPLTMSYLTKEAAVEPGQLVVTSGLGLFPKGIPVGRVVAMHKGAAGLTMTADLEPLVGFDHLEEILIILDSLPGG